MGELETMMGTAGQGAPRRKSSAKTEPTGSPGLPPVRPPPEEPKDYGLVYDGELNEEGEWEGQGALKLGNGDFYEGTFKAGDLDGPGFVRYGRGSVYEGEFRAGLQEGRGTLQYAEGGKYEGEWRAGRRHGSGTSTYASGNVFEGTYEEGKRAGLGTWRYADGTVEVHFYKADTAVGEGVRWNRLDKDSCWDDDAPWRAWRLLDTQKKDEISLEEARRIAQGHEPYLDE